MRTETTGSPQSSWEEVRLSYGLEVNAKLGQIFKAPFRLLLLKTQSINLSQQMGKGTNRREQKYS